MDEADQGDAWVKANNLTRDEARARAALVSDVHYNVSLDLTNSEETFGSETIITLKAARGEATFLDLVADAVTAVELNGEPVGGDAFDGVRVHLPEFRLGANEVRIVAEHPYGTTGVGLHRFVDPVDDRVYLHTQMEAFDAHRVFPCFDQPDMKASFEVNVRAPAGWEVASNSPSSEEPDRATGGWWRFAATPKMSTYLVAVVAGPYHIERDRHGDIALTWWVRQSLKQYLDTDELFAVTKQGFDFFANAFDYSYPWGKYDQLFVPEFNAGAMENIGAVTFSEAYVFRGKVTDAERERRAETILHEMAHMWFGDLVTMKWWDDLWLNESFATFMAVYSQANATRWKHAWVTFTDSEKTWAYRQDQLPTTHPIVADCPDVESVEVNFDGISYAKGASVLRQLVAWVGEDEFIAGVRNHIRRHEYGNADLASFLKALEETSGRDLSAWALEWLQRPGVNTLRPIFEVTDGVYESFAVMQGALPEFPTLRRHRIAVGLYDATVDGLVRRRRVELDLSGPSTDVPELVGETQPDLLLLNDDDLTFAKIRLDDRSLDTLQGRLAEVREPLARALCWTSAWDMVRDGELAARRWLDLVLANIGGEDRLTVIRSLLTKAASAVLVYGDPANREPALTRFAAAALEGTRSAPASSDVQLAWARAFIGNATTPDQLSLARSLLDGTASIDGLTVDTELRWLIVRSLAAAGAGGEDLIQAELERDPTDMGQRRAAGSRAARPDAAAKAAAWSAITEDEEIHFATVRAVMEGFQQHAQREILEPYAEKYFDVLHRIWETREIKVALEFAETMYPHVCIDRAVVEMTDRYLASEEVPGPVRRFLLEGRDGILRAMRARTLDATTT